MAFSTGDDHNPEGGPVRTCDFSIDIYPVLVPLFLTIPPRPNRKILPGVWSEVVQQHNSKSLRSLAREYGVSHEAVRTIIRSNIIIKPKNTLLI